MITIRDELMTDIPAREALLDAALGDGRFAKASERLREGRLPADGLSFAATEKGRLIGTVRLWNVSAGPGRLALLLGPLVVDPEARRRGVGGALVRCALCEAKQLGHRAVLLVGDAEYYRRFGFSAQDTGLLWMPGPYDRHRLLGLELVEGMISATGASAPKPDLKMLVATKSTTPRRRAA